MLRPTVAVASLPPSPSPEHPGMPGAQSGSVQELGATPPQYAKFAEGHQLGEFLGIETSGPHPYKQVKQREKTNESKAV